MFAEERRAEIAKLVASARRVNGADLARRYDVTMETVRRDLAALEEAGSARWRRWFRGFSARVLGAGASTFCRVRALCRCLTLCGWWGSGKTQQFIRSNRHKQATARK